MIILQVSKILVTNPLKPLFWYEYLTLRLGVMINFGWVTTASILSVSICFKKFETPFSHESVWAICILCVAFVIYTVNSVLYGQPFYQAVFAYVNFALFDRFNKSYKSIDGDEQ